MSSQLRPTGRSEVASLLTLLTCLALVAGSTACSREPSAGEAPGAIATAAEGDACCPPEETAAAHAGEAAGDACCPPGDGEAAHAASAGPGAPGENCEPECDHGSEDDPDAEPEGVAGQRHEAAGDYCSSHRVAEARCALCLPSIAPALLEASERALSGEGGPLLRLGRPDAAERSGLRVTRAGVGPARATASAYAEIVDDQDRIARLTCPAGGVVVSLSADLGRAVQAGDALAALRSPEIARARGEFREAAARLQQAEADAARQRRLRTEGLLSERDFLEGEKDVEVARASFAATERRLRALTGESPDVARLEVTDQFVLRSPIAGIVASREVVPGQMVGAEETIVTVTDPRRLWIDLGVREADAPFVRVGQGVRLSLDAHPGEVHEGRITAVPPALDPHSRTLRARASIDNAGGRLVAGMFGRAEIEIGASEARSTIEDVAVQRVEEQPVAFVRLEEDLFEVRRLQLGRRTGDRIEVFAGLEPGEEVVADGAFLLKTEVSKGSIGAGCCDHVEALGRRR